MARSRAAVSAGFFLQGFVFAAIVTQTPRQQDRFTFGEGVVTVILVLVALVAGVGSVLAGLVASRRDSGLAYRLSLLGIGVGAALVGLAPSLPLLVAAFVLYGIALGGVDASMNMQGVRVQALAGRSLMTGFHGLWSVGGIVGAGYASLVGTLDVPLGVDLSLVAVVVVVVTLLAAPAFVHDRFEDPGLVAEGLPWRPVLVLGLVICVFYAADTGTLSWSSVYLDDALDASATVVPLGYAAYQLGALVSRFSGDLLVRRHGARTVVTAGLALGLLGYLAVVAAPTPWLAVVAFGVAALGTGVLAPLAFAALAASVPDHTIDVAIARMNLANYLGAILGGGIIGAVAGGGSLRWAFVVPLVLLPLVLVARPAFARATTRQ
ncbi:MAG: MFS transporter [Aeromicrobium erythreum]